MERKTIKFEVKDIDEETGIIEGYGATFSKTPDSYGDVIDAGAFTKTLKEDDGTIVSLFNHNINEPIGLPELTQDKTGLHARIKLVKGVQRAEEVLMLAKAGVIKRMSIGYDTIKSDFVQGIRHLKEVKLYDVSPVVFAANREAEIVSVKSATSFDDLPLGDREREWDASAAKQRIRAWAGGEDISWSKYRKAFLWFDSDNPEVLGSYKLPFADIVNDRLTAIPRGIFAAAGAVSGARGGVNIPSDDADRVKSHLNQYYSKMRKAFDDDSLVAPWEKSDDLDDIEVKLRELEEKAGRVLSSSNRSKVQAALDALRALLSTADGDDEDPDKSSPSPDSDADGAALEAAFAELRDITSQQELKSAEAQIDSYIQSLNKS